MSDLRTETMSTNDLLAGDLASYPVYRISPADTNKFALLCDATDAAIPLMMCIEIFDVGGATPINVHREAFEHFYVLHGTGVAVIDGQEVFLRPGAHVLVPPKSSHVVRNTGATRLYVLTTMVPDENFCALIKSGTRDFLDREDIAVLSE